MMDRPPRRVGRRRLLAGLCAAGGLAVAGCLGESGDGDAGPVEPVDCSGLACDVCGMLIDEHPGPAAQAFFAGGEPEGRDGPARFDTVFELRTYLAEREAMGWELRQAFVTDYAAVDYELERHDGRAHISAHPEADAFVDHTTVHYAVETGIHGAMGEDFIPFSDGAEAMAFAAEHGGEAVSWGELDAFDVGR